MHNLPPVYYIIFTAITAAAVLLQALVMLGLFLVLKKAIGKMIATSEEVKQHALPLVATTRSLVEDISPKLKTTTSNLVEVSDKLRVQVGHIGETVDTLVSRTDTQIRRVDEMVTGTFNAVDHVTNAIENVVAAPVRRLFAVIQALKTGTEVFFSKKRPVSENAPAQDAESQEKKPA